MEIRNFHKLWLYVLFYKIGDWIRIIAIPLAIYEKTGSALYMASAYGITFIPWLLSIFGGVVSDKFSKRIILKISSILSTIMLVTIMMTLKNEDFSIHLFMFLLLILSIIEPFSHPAEQSFIPLLVNKEDLFSANSAIQLINNILSAIGPVIGGIATASLSYEVSLFISCLFFLASFIPLSLISEEGSPTLSHQHNIFYDIKEGIRVAFRTKFVILGSFLFFFTNFSIHIFQANLVFFIVGILGYSALQVSVVLSIAGCGAILGSVFAKNLNKKYSRPSMIIAISTLLAGFSTYLLCCTKDYILIGIILGVTYFLGSINVVTYFSTRQRLISQEYLGRVVSVTRLISFLSIPIGAFLGGILINNLNYSVYAIVILSATIRTLAGVFAFLFLKE